MPNEEVLGLDVPVDDVLRVAVAEGPRKLQDVLSTLRESEASG